MANETAQEIIADHTSNAKKDDCDKIDVEKLENILKDKLRRDSPLSDECCIFRVPTVLRRHKPEAYGPDVVSIGPFHDRRDKQFQPMEKVKHWYLHNFLSVLDTDLKTLIQSTDINIEFEKQAREFYAEPLDHLCKNALIEMMILDGCFLLELFRKAYDSKKEDSTSLPAKNEHSFLRQLVKKAYSALSLLVVCKPCRRVKGSPISLPEDQPLGSPMSLPEHFPGGEILDGSAMSLPKDPGQFKGNGNDPMLSMACMRQYLFHDLLLLENQLPWFVLKRLYDLAVARGRGKYPRDVSLNVFVLKYFLPIAELKCYFKVYCNQSNHVEKDPDAADGDDILHILDLARTAIVFKFENLEKKPGADVIQLPPATSLSEAGVKFRKSSDEGILNVKFKKPFFYIPEFGIGELTEPLFRNLVAFEQCYHRRPHHITSYVFLMDRLINTSKDIDLLCGKEIISNWFSSETASKLFNNLYDDTVLNRFFYFDLCDQVFKYYDTPCHRWLEKLWRDYFGNPWTIISLVAAIVLLVLTILQTGYTIQAYYFPR